MEKYDIIGYSEVDFKDDSGKQVKGKSLFINREPTPSESERIVGRVCEKLFIDAGRASALYDKVCEEFVGNTAEFVYSPNGRLKPILTDIIVL